MSALNTDVIRRAWCAATSASPEEWSSANRARGQCAITACWVQAIVGGKLIRTVVTYADDTTESHYANLQDDGVELDLTVSQFPDDVEFGPWEERTREYVLSFPATLARYEAFIRRINEVTTLDIVRQS